MNLELRERDRQEGIWAGKRVARRADSPDGFIVLVGKAATDNDVLTFKLAAPYDFWFHVASESGSHVIVLNPDKLSQLPRDTQRFAASLAAGYSKAKGGGQVAVHWCRREDVRKPKGFAPGKVQLKSYRQVKVRPQRLE